MTTDTKEKHIEKIAQKRRYVLITCLVTGLLYETTFIPQPGE